MAKKKVEPVDTPDQVEAGPGPDVEPAAPVEGEPVSWAAPD